MNRRSEYIFSALTLAVGLYCVGVSIIKAYNFLETIRTTRIKTVLKDPNGNPVITQVSSYNLLDTDNNGKYDAVDIKIDFKGNVLISKEEKNKRLEDLTEQELELLKLKK